MVMRTSVLCRFASAAVLPSPAPLYSACTRSCGANFLTSSSHGMTSVFCTITIVSLSVPLLLLPETPTAALPPEVAPSRCGLARQRAVTTAVLPMPI